MCNGAPVGRRAAVDAHKEDLVTVVLDTGCSIALTHREEDFFELTATDGFINTANGKSAITGHGLVRWTFITEQGENVEVIVPAHLCPAYTQRLISSRLRCIP
jgi:hypothetical protein